MLMMTFNLRTCIVAGMSPADMGDTRVVDLEMVTATIKHTRSASKYFHSYQQGTYRSQPTRIIT